jgi:hypothetical protein
VPNTIMGAVLRIVDSGRTNSAWPPCAALAVAVLPVRTRSGHIIKVIDPAILIDSDYWFPKALAVRRYCPRSAAPYVAFVKL